MVGVDQVGQEINHWRVFGERGLDPDEVFALLVVGERTDWGSTRSRLLVGEPARYEIGFTGRAKSNPLLNFIGQSVETVGAMADELASRLEPVTRHATIAMSGAFKGAGSYQSHRVQIRTIPDKPQADVQSWPDYGAFAEASTPALDAVFVDLELAGAMDPIADGMRTRRDTRDLANLITLSTFPRLSTIEGVEQWTLVWDGLRRCTLNSVLQGGFSHPEIGPKSGTPSSPPGVGRMDEVEHAKFAALGSELVQDRRLHIVESFPHLVDNFFKLGLNQRQRVRRALQWHSRAVKSVGDMANFAYVAAIEALLAPDGQPCVECGQPLPGERNCAACSQPIHGISGRVTQILNQFAVETRDEFKRLIYPHRSAIAHGSLVSEIDAPLFTLRADHPIDLIILGTARSLLLNWLLNPPET